MFAKLLKYDFKAVFRYWWFLLPAIPVLCAVLGFAIRFLIFTIGDADLALVTVLLTLCIVFVVILLSASALLTPILTLIRFYRHLFTDEGYLTFTLPVKRRSLLGAKLLNALIFDTMYAALLMIGAAIVFLIVPIGTASDDLLLLEFANLLGMLFELLGGWSILYIFEFLLLFVALDLFSNLLLFFCITIGATVVKKAKLFVGIAIYYGVNSVLGGASQLLIQVVAFLSSAGLFTLMKELTLTEGYGALALFIPLSTAVIATLATVLWSITLGRLERKLNLS